MKKYLSPRPIVRLALVFLACLSTAFSAETPLKALVLSGDNNHNWKATTPVIVEALKASGRFDRVDVEENVPGMKPEAFAPYDVIVSNYNTFGSKRAAEIWDAATKKAFLDHIQKGHGLVIVHAGSSVFYDWPEFQALACGTWKDGTNHGKIHVNRVTFTTEKSPITDGLQPFWTKDEYWQKTKLAPEAKALAEVSPLVSANGSGKPETILLATEVAGGRGFALFLGHDVVAMSNPGFQTLLQRGAEWSATGKVTIPPANNWPAAEKDADKSADVAAEPAATVSDITLEALVPAVKAYQYAGNRSALIAGERLVGHAAGKSDAPKVAAALAALLADHSVSVDAKQYVCLQLRLIGGKAEVPALVALLKDKQIAAVAVETLEAIPAPEAAKALKSAAGSADPDLKSQIALAISRRDGPLGVIKSNPALVFGAKPEAKTLIAALSSSDSAKQSAALLAFGAHYTSANAVKIASALKGLPPGVKIAVLHTLGDHREKAAVPALLALAAAETDPAGNVALIAALGEIGDPSAIPFLLSQLASDQPATCAAASVSLEQVRGASASAQIADAIGKLPPESQASVITVLGLRRDPASLTSVLNAAKSDDAKVRQAAIRAAGKIADASQVPVLLAAIDAARPDDLALWEKALASVAGTGNREAGVPPIAEALKKAGEDRVPMLLVAAGAAGTDSALALLRDKLQSPDDAVRRVVLSAMGRALNPALLPDLQKAAVGDSSTSLRKLALRKLTDTVLADKDIIPEPTLQVLVLAVPAASDSDDRRALLAALGLVKSEKALALVEQIATADPAVASEAALATTQIYKLLRKTPPAPKPVAPSTPQPVQK